MAMSEAHKKERKLLRAMANHNPMHSQEGMGCNTRYWCGLCGGEGTVLHSRITCTQHRVHCPWMASVLLLRLRHGDHAYASEAR